MTHPEGRPISNATYVNHGCRCLDCKAAHAQYQAAYMAANPVQRQRAANRRMRRRAALKRLKEQGKR